MDEGPFFVVSKIHRRLDFVGRAQARLLVSGKSILTPIFWANTLGRTVQMITDIFAARYENIPIWSTYGEPERRLLGQCWLIISEDLFNVDSAATATAKEDVRKTWSKFNSMLCREIGQTRLDQSASTSTLKILPEIAAKHYLLRNLSREVNTDLEMKRRISYIEIGLREYREKLIISNANLAATVRQDGRIGLIESIIAQGAKTMLSAYTSAESEINIRFQQAGTKLIYQSGFIHFDDDRTVTTTVSAPFWPLVASPRWENVEKEMKDAIDHRDKGLTDSGFHAAKSLESAIKVISGERGLTTGKEKGAVNFVENIAKESPKKLLQAWQAESIRLIFSKVRNPQGHGAGTSPRNDPSDNDSDWMITNCMSWIRWLVVAHESGEP